MGEADRAEFARFGVEPGWGFAIRHRVRWSECDPFGHANHRAYFEWFEEARNRYLKMSGSRHYRQRRRDRSWRKPAFAITGRSPMATRC
jgi:Thioesterase-like superfamily